MVTLASKFLSQNYMFHNDSSTTCLSGKPQGLLATIFTRGPDYTGHAKTHPWIPPRGPCELAAQRAQGLPTANASTASCCLSDGWQLLQEGKERGHVRLQLHGETKGWASPCSPGKAGRNKCDQKQNFAFHYLTFPSHSPQLGSMQREQHCSPHTQADESRDNTSLLSHSTVPTNIGQGKS